METDWYLIDMSRTKRGTFCTLQYCVCHCRAKCDAHILRNATGKCSNRSTISTQILALSADSRFPHVALRCEHSHECVMWNRECAYLCACSSTRAWRTCLLHIVERPMLTREFRALEKKTGGSSASVRILCAHAKRILV